MEAGCYYLHLYCDRENQGHDYDEFPHEYLSDQTRPRAVSRARRHGWVFHRDGTHNCPKCAGMGLPLSGRWIDEAGEAQEG